MESTEVSVSADIARIDPRLKQLSYSSVLTLRSCPRKFQLYRSKAKAAEQIASKNLTFAFGHMVGTGIQDILEDKPWEEVLLNAFLAWDVDIHEENEKQHKSFWVGVQALKRFRTIRTIGRLKDFELVYYQGKPACELSFMIHLPDGFRYRGFVDAVLRHKLTGKILVLENKTTGSKTVSPATFKNSFQGVGYSIVLDELFPDYSAYEVLYLVYQTHTEDFIEMPFAKTFGMRARWLTELALVPELIRMYTDMGTFPMHGESCFNYFSECEYYGTCTMSDKYMIPALPAAFEAEQDEELERFQVHVTLEELIEAQQLRMANQPDDVPQERLIPSAESGVDQLLDDMSFN